MIACGGKELTLQNLPDAAAELVKAGHDLKVWLLNGEMGAGKTTLVREIVSKCGIIASVVSPTFSIVNEYGKSDSKIIYHFDLYRMKNENEALDIGIEEYLDSGNLCLIEWPEIIKSLWPIRYFEILIEQTSQATRKIYYRRHD